VNRTSKNFKHFCVFNFPGVAQNPTVGFYKVAQCGASFNVNTEPPPLFPASQDTDELYSSSWLCIGGICLFGPTWQITILKASRH